jgi:hypothetical protein
MKLSCGMHSCLTCAGLQKKIISTEDQLKGQNYKADEKSVAM